MNACRATPPGCSEPFEADGVTARDSDCGNIAAVPYFVTFQILGQVGRGTNEMIDPV